MNGMLGYIRIQPKHAPALQRALLRARVAGINSDPELHYTTAHPGDSLDTLMVSSSTEPHHRYEVAIRVIGREVFSKCACRAGASGVVCQHVALALEIMGFEQVLITMPLCAREEAIAA